VEFLIAHHSNGRLVTLPTNIRLWWHGIAVTNTLAYYDMATITTKFFIVQA